MGSSGLRAITFQTDKMLGRGSEPQIEHSPAIAYEPLGGRHLFLSKIQSIAFVCFTPL